MVRSWQSSHAGWRLVAFTAIAAVCIIRRAVKRPRRELQQVLPLLPTRQDQEARQHVCVPKRSMLQEILRALFECSPQGYGGCRLAEAGRQRLALPSVHQDLLLLPTFVRAGPHALQGAPVSSPQSLRCAGPIECCPGQFKSQLRCYICWGTDGVDQDGKPGKG
jgi:hypothetical protein